VSITVFTEKAARRRKRGARRVAAHSLVVNATLSHRPKGGLRDLTRTEQFSRMMRGPARPDVAISRSPALGEAVLGGKIAVPTPTGPVTMRFPKWSRQGAPPQEDGHPDGTRGDEYVTLKVMLPDRPNRELDKFVAHWLGHGLQPASERGGMMDTKGFLLQRASMPRCCKPGSRPAGSQ